MVDELIFFSVILTVFSLLIVLSLVWVNREQRDTFDILYTQAEQIVRSLEHVEAHLREDLSKLPIRRAQYSSRDLR